MRPGAAVDVGLCASNTTIRSIPQRSPDSYMARHRKNKRALRRCRREHGVLPSFRPGGESPVHHLGARTRGRYESRVYREYRASAGLGMHGRAYLIRTGCAARACVRGTFEMHARTVIRGQRRKKREVGNPYAGRPHHSVIAGSLSCTGHV